MWMRTRLGGCLWSGKQTINVHRGEGHPPGRPLLQQIKSYVSERFRFMNFSAGASLVLISIWVCSGGGPRPRVPAPRPFPRPLPLDRAWAHVDRYSCVGYDRARGCRL